MPSEDRNKFGTAVAALISRRPCPSAFSDLFFLSWIRLYCTQRTGYCAAVKPLIKSYYQKHALHGNTYISASMPCTLGYVEPLGLLPCAEYFRLVVMSYSCLQRVRRVRGILVTTTTMARHKNTTRLRIYETHLIKQTYFVNKTDWVFPRLNR